MHAADDRNEFTPPQPPGTLRALGLALLAHLLLLGALTWGVHWKRQSDNDLGLEAELWSALPQQAAPRPVEPPPPPPAPPEPAPRPAPAPPRQAAPDQREAEIAVAREKKRLEKEKQERLKLEQEKKEKAEREKERERQAREKERQKQQERERQLAEDKKRQEQEAKRKEAARAQEEAKRLEAQRQEHLRRIAGLAGATGGESSSGTAQRASGPSAGYAGRIRARIKPNIVFTDDVAGNPTAEVEVRAAPDGTIVSRRLIKGSGIKAWDEAVLKAIDKTEVLPRDVDGRVPPTLVISFRPKD